MTMIHERSVLLGLLLATACSATTATAQSYRETKVANHFQIFAPPNNNAGTRYSVVVVTALAGTATDPCIVDLVDDGADGDTDDTQLNVSLTKGESLIRYIRDGAVNDDSGAVWDGDYFLVDATQPVSVYIATDSDWQHDCVRRTTAPCAALASSFTRMAIPFPDVTSMSSLTKTAPESSSTTSRHPR
jgi:hypothetical protein